MTLPHPNYRVLPQSAHHLHGGEEAVVLRCLRCPPVYQLLVLATVGLDHHPGIRSIDFIISAYTT